MLINPEKYKYKYQDLVGKYPFVGEVVKWDNNRNLGDIASASIKGKIFAHIDGCDACYENFSISEGIQIVFAYGGNPKKPNCHAVNWLPSNVIDGDTGLYPEFRSKYFDQCSLDQFFSILDTSWYAKLWPNNDVPTRLESDEPLKDALRRYFGEFKKTLDIKKYVLLSDRYVNSNYCDPDKFLDWVFDDENYDLRTTETFQLNELITICKLIGKKVSLQFLRRLKKCRPAEEKKLIDFILTQGDFDVDFKLPFSAKAIDIESNGKEVFEFGYADTSRQYSVKPPLSVISEIESFSDKTKGSWLIGHNIISWDIPVIRSICKSNQLFSANPVWDTLLVEWIFEPWKTTHALQVLDNAHHADQDARVALALFELQFSRLPKVAVEEHYKNPQKDILSLLFEKPQYLNTVKNRMYPKSDLRFDTKLTLLPESVLKSTYWCTGIKYLWPKGHNNPLDYAFDLDRLLDYETENDFERAAIIVIKQAIKNGVEVLAGMIPPWLREHITKLIDHGTVMNTFGDETASAGDKTIYISSYRAFSGQSISWIFDNKFKLEFVAAGLLESCLELKTLSDQQVAEVTNQNPSRETLFFITEKSPLADMVKPFDKHFSYWMHYRPNGTPLSRVKPWTIWQVPRLDILQSAGNTPSCEIMIPKWLYPGSRIEFAEDMIWPSSMNRDAYWQDTLRKLCSVIAASKDQFIIFCVNDDDVQVIHDILVSAGLTADSRSDLDSYFRQCEQLRKLGKNLAVSPISRCNGWTEAALSWNLKPLVIIDSIPLVQWWMCLHSKDGFDSEHWSNRKNDVDDPDNDMDDHERQGADSIEANVDDTHVLNSLQECCDQFLVPWVNSVIKASMKELQIILLDSRMRKLLSSQCRVHEYPCIGLPNEINEAMAANRHKLGITDSRPAPIDYVHYQKFLKDHWGYEDFKEQTQKPAITEIIGNDKDVLVRLPTGEGKSVLFQVPALLRGMHTQKLTVVITPLRALMRDQVVSLWEKKFYQSVDYLSGDREIWETDEVYQGIIDNRIKLLFVAPERFRVQRFKDALYRRILNDNGLEYVVFDEAHCLSQWGFQFRPDYLFAISEIRNLRKLGKLPKTSLLMFSATVTNFVMKDLLCESGAKSIMIKPDNYLHPVQDFITINKEEMVLPLYNSKIDQDVRFSERIGVIENIISKKADLKLSAVIIFVSRRDHAEDIANCLADSFEKMSNGNTLIRYFHAGLPPAERLHVYEELKQGKVNVLACTKAFGMGMDISNIHWCVHLAPPNCLEDYLQEVGRTGRDPKSRSKASLDMIECHLLANPMDFSRNHELIQENSIGYENVRELWLQLYKDAQVLANSNLRLCVIPTDKKTASLSGNKLRNGLFWLERSGKLKIAAYTPSFLPVELNFTRLENATEGDSVKSRVAEAILKIYDQWDKPQSPTVSPASEVKNTIISDCPKDNIVVAAIKSYIGFLFGSPKHITEQPRQTTESPWEAVLMTATDHSITKEAAQLNIANIVKEAKLRRVEDLYASLYQLEKESALHVIRNIEFEERAYCDKAEILYSWLMRILSRIIGPTHGVLSLRIEELVNELELPEHEAKAVTTSNKLFWKEQTIRTAKRNAMMAAVKLCGSVQLSLTEKHEHGVSVLCYELPKTKCDKIKCQVDKIINASKIILAKLSKDDLNASKVLSFSELIDVVNKDYQIKISHLKAAIKLLSNLGIYHTSQPLIPYSYVLEILQVEHFTEQHEIDGLDIEHPDRMLKLDLDRVNQMTQLRSYAFELFGMLPPEMRRDFIDCYFAAGTVDELNRLLEDKVKAVEDVKLNGQLRSMLQKVRKEAIENEFQFLKNGQEPRQYEACVRPYNMNLLINAGPGAGKTRVLLTRAIHLIDQQGIKPWQILILAFNRAIVHEIRTRIKDLFDQLGYGGYAAKIKVFTFHAYALSSLGRFAPDVIQAMVNVQAQAGNNDSGVQDSILDAKWKKFVELFTQDPAFKKKVVEDIKVVMVDEFQDMDDSRYEFLKAFHDTGVNLTVIGDDDQDIIRYQRESRKEAIEYFEKFTQDFNPDVINLCVNFRSGNSIVERSQKLLNAVLLKYSNRTKSDKKQKLISRKDSPSGQVIDKFTESQLREIAQSVLENKESLAILCRDNQQAAEVYMKLKPQFPDLVLQGKTNVKLSWTRSVGKWMDCCNTFLDQKENDLFTRDYYEEIRGMYVQSGIAEAEDMKKPYNIQWLWETSLKENPYMTVREHVDFLEDLTIDEYVRIYGKEDRKKEIVVSTIHKVKGLEFDTVCILSSEAKFPFDSNGHDNQKCAADEIRSYYVAMTRAKSKLYLEWGNREKEWAQKRSFAGNNGGAQTHLKGNLEEVFISWSGFDINRQNYIEKHVSIGDSVIVNSCVLSHSQTEIAKLKTGIQANTSELCVTDVIRYPIAEDMPFYQNCPDIYAKITDECKQRGWLYVPLVSS